jgi:hypothetical protein
MHENWEVGERQQQKDFKHIYLSWPSEDSSYFQICYVDPTKYSKIPKFMNIHTKHSKSLVLFIKKIQVEIFMKILHSYDF